MIALARTGAPEGLWLRAERQTAGRGRQGRAWVSPPGNLYASTIVRLRPSDPPAATLALVAAVALEEAVSLYYHPGEGRGPGGKVSVTERSANQLPLLQLGPGLRRGGLFLKWPNDLLIGGAKLAGILLERAEDAVVIGTGVNLAHHPADIDRPATSLAAHGVTVEPAPFIDTLAETFARWLARWRGEGLAPIRERWTERAHPAGAALTARLPDGSAVDGLFERIDADGALILRLADGTRRVIHAGDVFLI
ncbi:biotin--[acetyl-CoA-carboxylase] ligase [Sphingomonas koreensis]|nr:biotin--[acetyl-CoA-carboxylase] ligase [Sphingomonas koreensis]